MATSIKLYNLSFLKWRIPNQSHISRKCWQWMDMTLGVTCLRPSITYWISYLNLATSKILLRKRKRCIQKYYTCALRGAGCSNFWSIQSLNNRLAKLFQCQLFLVTRGSKEKSFPCWASHIRAPITILTSTRPDVPRNRESKRFWLISKYQLCNVAANTIQ